MVIKDEWQAELKQIAIAVSQIDNEYDTSEQLRYDGSEEIEYRTKIAYVTLLAFIDKHNLPGIRDYVTTNWKKFENDLNKTFYTDRGGGNFLEVTTNFLIPILRALTSIYSKRDEELIDNNVKFKLPELIRLIPNTATKLGLEINSEDKLDKLVEAFLIPLYPDLNSNPSLTLPEGYRQPDSSIQTLSLLIEYKFMKKASDLRNTVDEIQADIRNYAQEPWKYLYVIVGMNNFYTTEEKLRNTIFKEPTTFKKMFLSLVRF